MTDTSKPYTFGGYASPNTTPVPDVLFDEFLLQLDNAELRVLLYIIRRTYGFKRSTDDIAISQMVDGIRKKDGTVLDRGTGMSKGSVTRGLRGLLGKGVILARRNTSKEHGFEPTTYALKFKNEAEPLVSGTRQAPLVSPADPPLSHRRDIQETVIQQTDSSNIRTAAQETTSETPNDIPSGTQPGEDPDARTARESSDAALGITVARGGAPKPVGELLHRYRQHKPANPEEADERAAITATVKTLAPELGDKAPVRSSVTRAYHLYQRSRLPLTTFVAELYGVRSDVKDIATRRKIKNRMSYFFGLLEDRLGLSTEKPKTS
jgi:hypothetical protein